VRDIAEGTMLFQEGSPKEIRNLPNDCS